MKGAGRKPRAPKQPKANKKSNTDAWLVAGQKAKAIAAQNKADGKNQKILLGYQNELIKYQTEMSQYNAKVQQLQIRYEAEMSKHAVDLQAHAEAMEVYESAMTTYRAERAQYAQAKGKTCPRCGIALGANRPLPTQHQLLLRGGSMTQQYASSNGTGTEPRGLYMSCPVACQQSIRFNERLAIEHPMDL